MTVEMKAEPSPPRPYWRSMLSVPASSQRFVERAHIRGADAILLDLEDGVAPSEKDRARRDLPRAIGQVGRGSADILVWINQPWDLARRDLDAAIQPDVAAIELPKVSSGQQVRALDALITEISQQRGLRGPPAVVLAIEGPLAPHALDEACAASPLAIAVELGTEDFSQILGVQPDSEVLLPVHTSVVVAARRTGLLPLGLVGTVANYRDGERFRALCRRSRRFGYTGGGAIHPLQVPILNREFSPSHEELDEARGVLDVFDRAVAEGRGAVEWRGSMVDEPVARRARAILHLADVIASETRRRETRVRSSGQAP